MVLPYSAAIGGYVLLGCAFKIDRCSPLLGQEASPDLILHAPLRDVYLHGIDAHNTVAMGA
jgi:hypothetical protein